MSIDYLMIKNILIEAGLQTYNTYIDKESHCVVFQFLSGTKYADIDFYENAMSVVLLEDLTDRNEVIFEFDNTLESVHKTVKQIKDFLTSNSNFIKKEE